MDLMYGIGLVLLYIFEAIRIVLDVIAKGFFHLRYMKKPSEIPIIKNEIVLIPATSLASKIRKRQLKSLDVVAAYSQRIADVNEALNAVVNQDVDKLISDAKGCDEFVNLNDRDEEYLEKSKPLLGVPFTVKENIQVEGLKQTAGLTALRDNISKRNAKAVQLMKDAGAVVLGVTNVSQLCTSWETVNPVYGRTTNPYDTRRIAGGSSGGEGSIIAAAGSVIGIGSDIAGSVRLPAYFNGIFAHKPSKGIVPNDGMQPDVPGELDDLMTIGPICRYASDLIPVYKVLADENVSRLKLNQQVDMKKLKIYYMDESGSNFLMSKVSKDVKDAQNKVSIVKENLQEEVIQHFETVHGVTAQKVKLTNLSFSLQIYLALLCKYKYVDTLYTNYLTGGKGKPNVYSEFLRYLVGKSPYILSTIMVIWMESVVVRFGQSKFQSFVDKRNSLSFEFEQLLRDDAVFLYPSHPTTALYHRQPYLQFFNCSYAAIFNALGLPVTQCPLGLSKNGLPIGVQVVASMNNDHLTLAVAQELENAFGGWTWPVPKT